MFPEKKGKLLTVLDSNTLQGIILKINLYKENFKFGKQILQMSTI